MCDSEDSVYLDGKTVLLGQLFQPGLHYEILADLDDEETKEAEHGSS